MNFQKFWKENDIWKHDPYISENKDDIEERCAEYGWESCKNEVLKILKGTQERVAYNDNGTWYWEQIDKIKEIEKL